jgi:hypothetical protein
MAETRNKAEHIGYFSADMVGIDVFKLLHFMKFHGVYMQKSNPNPDDYWWYFQLPKGTTKVRQEDYQGDVPRYTVLLPDDFSFTLEMGGLDRDGFFFTPPRVFIDVPQDFGK